MTGTNIHDGGRGRYAGGETPTNDDHLATKKYVDDNGGTVDVTDGSVTVTGLTELDFTSGATVTDAGGGVAQVAIAGGGSQPVTHALYGGNNVSIPNTGAATHLTWDVLGPNTAALLDISTPAIPTIVTTGVYAISVVVFPVSAMADGKAYELQLSLDSGALILKQTYAVADVADFDTYGTLTAVYYLAAGATVELTVQQADAGAKNFVLEIGSIQRLA